MKVKDNKCKCGHDDFFFIDKGNQKGIYCSYCGKWLKWADKDEQNLNMKQVSVLDKIRAEIEQIDFDFGDFYDNTRTIKKKVLEVIDKYKAESEDYETK